ncbi:MAG: hypothetical protein HN742_35585 [Lentisphaerae bacterium]|nr:hypothetical protein [Lentisphaerota bacterium]MBT5610080.1 hypothetical protein [Lentisphaerota bacterium]MBT7059808.1 hypothetical protein [Lentisphaerota bacterium]MBT7847247.1 hypothetical protein [Lentisphaerota bacterium]
MHVCTHDSLELDVASIDPDFGLNFLSDECFNVSVYQFHGLPVWAGVWQQRRFAGCSGRGERVFPSGACAVDLLPTGHALDGDLDGQATGNTGST